MENKPVVLFEGIDGSGKTYALMHLKEYYEKLGEKVHLVDSIPYHTFLDSHDKTWFDLTNRNTRYMEYISWQVNNYYKNIKPFLGKEIILIDRFLPSCYAYNSLDNDQYTMLFMFVMGQMLQQFFIPSLTFLFDVSDKVLLERYKVTEQPEAMKNLNFTNAVRGEYDRFVKTFGKQYHVHKIDGNQPIERTLVQMLNLIEGKEIAV